MDEDAIRDAFEVLGPVRITRMFGGASVSFDGRPFALVFRGQIYLKANQDTSPVFASAGSEPFLYLRSGREVALGYWTAPLDALDTPEEMKRWAELALSIAKPRRAEKGKSSPRGKSKISSSRLP